MPDNRRTSYWTKQKIHELITLYEQNECLWNCSLESYKDREKRLMVINKICKIMGITKEQFAKKIHNLRNQLNFELKKTQNRNSATDGTEIEEYATKWEYFDRLQFLTRFITSRPNFGSFKTEIIEEINSNSERSRENSPQAQQALTDFKHNANQSNSTQNNQVNVNNFDHQLGDQCSQSFHSTESIKTQASTVHSPRNTKLPDEWDIFGQFITSELRSLKNEISRKKLKRKIMQAILEVGSEDDKLVTNSKRT